jgi:hypothetical protein
VLKMWLTHLTFLALLLVRKFLHRELVMAVRVFDLATVRVVILVTVHVAGRSRQGRSRRSRRSGSRSSRRSYRSTSRSSYPRDRSPSRSSRRRRHRSHSSDWSSNLRHLPADDVPAISRENVRSLRSWILRDGLLPAEAKAVREIFTPSFESSFTLQCPLLDESMGRTLKRLNGSSGSVVDFVEKT